MSAQQETILFCSPFDDATAWRDAILTELPGAAVRVHPDTGDPEAVTVAMVWMPPKGFFSPLRNLKLIINLGSGVDMLLRRSDLPDVPVMRIVDGSMVAMMTGYVLFAVLRYARDFDRLEEARRDGRWRYMHPRPFGCVKVGVLGLGALGAAAATALARLGFDVHGWSRTPKKVEGVSCVCGPAALDELLSECEIVVAMLPLTPETRHLLEDARLGSMRRGAKLINVGRGSVVDERALIARLESGHLGGATLDVFEREPLPQDSPLWRMPNVMITPHLASIAVPHAASRDVAESIRRVRNGLQPLNAADFARGY